MKSEFAKNFARAINKENRRIKDNQDSDKPNDKSTTRG